MSVRELAERIKVDPDFGSPPVILLSAAGQRGDGQRCREVGVSGYLSKPVSRQDILDMAVAVLKPRPAGDGPVQLVTQHSLRERRCLRILMAEDNRVNQKLAVHMLEKAGHQVSVVWNGREAVEAVARENFDLLLMDVQMPEMDGLEATASIRQSEQASGEHIPIVAMTAYAMTGDKGRCLQAGMDAYVTKPISRDILLREIERCTADVSSAGTPIGASKE